MQPCRLNSRKRLQAVTLLELLMVLVVVAAISTLFYRHYLSLQQQTQVAGVQSDVRYIMQALNRYYQHIGCAPDGDFPVDKLQPSLAELGLPAQYQSRPPLITAYKVAILPTGAYTAEPQHKEIYELDVFAVLNSAFSSAQQRWYTHVLNAAGIQGGELYWSSLPNNNVSAAGSKLWVLGGGRQVFRWYENDDTIQSASTLSSAYCAQ